MFKRSIIYLKSISGVMGVLFCCTLNAQGIPVYDATAVYQMLLQIQAWEKQYQQMVSTINQQQQMIQNMSGSRALGMINNGITQPILPTNITQQIAATQTHDELNVLAATNMQALSDAMKTRATQIQSLMAQINQTDDQKSIQELTARIQAEQVMATNEAKEAESLQSQVRTQQQMIDRQQLNSQVDRLR